MAVVVDINLAAEVFTLGRFPILLRWIVSHPNGRVLACRAWVEECGNRTVLGVVRELERSGRVIWTATEEVERERARLEAVTCVSNDRHLLSLMRAAGARLIATRDVALKADVKNRVIIPAPPGKIYSERQRRAAEALLRLFGELGG